nr:class I SAM-dependent methyltransferase [uncultured Dyadobacter sp.]
MLNNYDRIAGNYDQLSRLVFGKAIVRAQQSLIPLIHSPARMLIAGGGTGWILEEIAHAQPSGLSIDYVEISAKMVGLARKRSFGSNRVNFVHSGIEEFNAPTPYDFVITPFLFDNFDAERAATNFQKLHAFLNPGGQWLFTDFNIEKGLNGYWQKALLRTMYLFFKTISDVEASRLPDMQALFNTFGYEISTESYHFGGFIRSAAYQKLGDGSPPSPKDETLIEDNNRQEDQ